MPNSTQIIDWIEANLGLVIERDENTGHVQIFRSDAASEPLAEGITFRDAVAQLLPTFQGPMSFSRVLIAMKQGYAARRSSWASGYFIELASDPNFFKLNKNGQLEIWKVTHDAIVAEDWYTVDTHKR